MTDTQTPIPKRNDDAPKLYRFVGLIFLWLIPCFFIWVSLSSFLAAPAVWASEQILTYALPDIINTFSLSGSQAMLTTHFGDLDGQIVSARAAGYRLAFPLNTRIVTYSLPFYAALHFATPSSNTTSGNDANMAGLCKGLLLLYPLIILGLISISLKNLMLGLGPAFIEGTSIGASLIGLGYQLSTLMVPTVAPIMIWAWQSRNSTLIQQLLIRK